MRRIRRPLLSRQMTGNMFGEDAVHVAQDQRRDARGVTITSSRRTAVRVATTPLDHGDSRAALLMQGGTRIEDIREFFADFTVDIKQRDKIVYPADGGDTYTIVGVSAYPSHNVLIGTRDESQG